MTTERISRDTSVAHGDSGGFPAGDVPELAYVIRMFPLLSETFVANEILALEQLGVRLRIFSYRKPGGSAPHAFLSEIRSPITYLPDPINRNVGQLLAGSAEILLKDPARYRTTLQHVLRHVLRERNSDTLRRLLQAGYLANALSRSSVQHIHAHFARGATRITTLAAMLTGLPYSFTAHARDIYHADVALLREQVAGAEFVITCAAANQQYLQELVRPAHRDKIKLSYHGVDLAKFGPGEPASDGGPPLVLSVGRLVQKKGFRYLLEAIAGVTRQGRDVRCVIAGEGPDRAMLERMVEELGLQDVVRLVGARSQEELIELYQQATVFALPCVVAEDGDRDGIPNVLLEAMASGLPVISCAVSGIPELVEQGHNGLLVEERSGRELAAAIELLLRDVGLRSRLGVKGRETVGRRFDLATSAKSIARIFAGSRAAGQQAVS